MSLKTPLIHIAFVFIILIIGLWMFRQIGEYGIANDEPIHQEHGEILFRYFTKGDTLASNSPFDPHGNIIISGTNFPPGSPQWSGMSFFGGGYDLMVTTFQHFFIHVDKYLVRHICNVCCYLILIFLCAFIVQFLTKEAISLIVVPVFIFFYPRLTAHGFFNPKDIPFATASLFFLYQMLLCMEGLPKISLRRIVFISLSIAICINIRFIGIFWLVLFPVTILFYWIEEFSKKLLHKNDLKVMFKNMTSVFIIIAISYVLLFVSWPYLQKNPFGIFKIALFGSGFNTFNSYNLFEGKWINNNETPWYYIIKWIYITMPLHVLFFLSIALFFMFTGKLNKYFIFLLIMILFPILLQLAIHTNVYDESRHFLFEWGLLAVLSSCGFVWMIKQMKNPYLSVFLLVFSVLEPLIYMVRNEGFWNLYFSPILSKNELFGKYELDYWGVNNIQAVKWIDSLAQNNQGNRINVRSWYGEPLSTSYYLDTTKNVRHIVCEQENPEWDYWVFNAAAGKYFQEWMKHWPPPNTVHEIKAGAIPVIAIIKNPNKDTSSVLYWFNRGMQYYQSGDFVSSNTMYEKVIQKDPKYLNAYNNLGYNYFLMKQYNRARYYYRKGLKIDSSNTFLLGNLSYINRISPE